MSLCDQRPALAHNLFHLCMEMIKLGTLLHGIGGKKTYQDTFTFGDKGNINGS